MPAIVAPSNRKTGSFRAAQPYFNMPEKKVGYTGNLKEGVMGKKGTMVYDFKLLRVIHDFEGK